MAIRLLIVDDELPLLRNLSSYLGAFRDDFDVHTASTAEEALSALEADGRFDLVLTDVKMPGPLDGIDLVHRAFTINRNLRFVVMTAFSTLEMRRRANAAGALRYLEKPLDVKLLRQELLAVAASRTGWSGSLAGLDLFDFIQLFVLSGRSTAVLVTDGDNRGTLVFRDGQLVHASTAHVDGDQAFYEITAWSGGEFREVARGAVADNEPNIASATNHLMMEAARLRDEAARAQGIDDLSHGEDDLVPEAGDLSAELSALNNFVDKEEREMAIKDQLASFEEIEGFKGVAVFTAQGEMLESLAKGKIDIKSVGMFANNALLNAQKATDQMGVGRGNLVQIRAPQAVVLMRCLNEATDFAASKEGKAHFHTVVVMDPEGNTGMAAMVLDKIQAGLADEMR